MGSTLYGHLRTWTVRVPHDVAVTGTTLWLPHGLGHARLSNVGLEQLIRLTDGKEAKGPPTYSTVRRMVDDLERRGFVTVALPWQSRFRAFFLAGIGLYRAPARLYSGSLLGVVEACVSATVWLLWVALSLTLWVIPLVLSLSATDLRPVLILVSPFIFWLFFTIVLIVHEMTHVLAVRAVGGSVARVMVRPHRIQLVSTPSPSRLADFVVATSGPLMAAGLGAATAAILSRLHMPALVVWTCLLLAALHLASLAPVFADGKMLARAIKGGRR